MNSNPSLFPTRKTRMGMHYFPDTLHYSDNDLQTWLPELVALGISWLVLKSTVDRAIPENFIQGLVKAGIEPLIEFNLPLGNPPDANELQTLLAAYAHWGVHGIIFFDRPNSRAAWSASGWAQQGLVDRFLDRFLPFANLALSVNLIPIFPPLEPGGSYWDTAFLRSSLESLIKRHEVQLLQKLVLSAYAWTGNHSLNWGAGGPARWPGARPYFTASDNQDQRGFRIFDWYAAIGEAVLQQSPQIILLEAGSKFDPEQSDISLFSPKNYSETGLTIAKLSAGEQVIDPSGGKASLEAMPEQVIASNFWLLAADPASPQFAWGWYQNEQAAQPIVDALKKYANEPAAARPAPTPAEPPMRKDVMTPANTTQALTHPIQHYLLLPTSEWIAADWHMGIIQPLIKKYHPTIGFSLQEAALASKVTILGGPQKIPEAILQRLQNAGCEVEQINADGTTIATRSSER
ncbi:MAG: hypothetical protein P4L50_01340 [Anaerolineaceae bacterium]|nr:hypothetical protein [Anaerolineaceae bacterium]